MSDPSTIQSAPSGTAFPLKSRGKLLIVDDEDGPRESLRFVFRDDYDLLLAADGPAAIELAQKNRVDVALLDIRMSGMSGIEVLERLKYVDPGIEVIMMTAFETTDTLRQAIRLRASDYINKPFDLPSIRAIVAGAMQKRALESEMNSNTEKLDKLLVQLQDQKMEQQLAQTRGDIYASIIHDINGPLSVISGFVQLMNQRIGNAERLEREDLEFVRERLKTIFRQVRNCMEISQRYLSFLRRKPGEVARVSINQLLADFEHLVRVHPSHKENRFVLQPVSDAYSVCINGTDLIQILLNLVVNGFQCISTPHAVEVTGEVFKEPLDLTVVKEKAGERVLNLESFANQAPILRMSVRDEGPGIPADVLPKVFQPYFTTKGPRQGTGLGLSIVVRLIKEADGMLQLSSEPGNGTTFSVYLPAAPLVM